MNIVTATVYGAAAVGFLALTLLSLTSWRGQPIGIRIIIACALSALWAAVLARHAWTGGMPLLLVYVSEICRDAAWICVLTAITGSSVPVLLSRCALGACILLLAVAGGWPWLHDRDWLPWPAELTLARGGLILMLLALVLLEQIFRNSNATARKSLRYFAFGVGAIFASDLFLYSQAELLKGIVSSAWTARGVVNVLAVPLIAIALRRNPQWSLDIFVSRQVVFHTATFAAVGAYLLLMAIGGYYVRGVGGEWGGAAQLVYFSGAAAVLVSLLLSVSLRRRLKVFLSKHFYRNKYDYRVEWLRFIKTLSARGDDIETTAVRAVAQIFGSPAGVLFTRVEGARGLIPAACWPMSLDELAGLGDVPMQSELAGLLERRQWIIDLQEYRRQPEAYDNLALPAWILESSELQIVAPILELERLTGFFLLFAPPAPFELTYEDRDLLKTVGRHVATALAQVAAARKLTEARQFETYNRLTAFVMHDLKNLIAQLSLVVANAEKHKRNPEFIDDAIETITNSVTRMNRLMEQLRHGDDMEAGRPVELATVVQRALTRCALRDPVPQLDAMEGYPKVVADPERLASVFEHVVRNAQDATPADGKVQVTVSCEGPHLCVSVTDTGVGMEGQFVRERLFRPFDTTKGAKGMGIGAYQAREYVRSLGGDIEVQSTPGKGTSVRLLLPVASLPAGETGATDSEIQERAARAEQCHAPALSRVDPL